MLKKLHIRKYHYFEDLTWKYFPKTSVIFDWKYLVLPLLLFWFCSSFGLVQTSDQVMGENNAPNQKYNKFAISFCHFFHDSTLFKSTSSFL